MLLRFGSKEVATNFAQQFIEDLVIFNVYFFQAYTFINIPHPELISTDLLANISLAESIGECREIFQNKVAA